MIPVATHFESHGTFVNAKGLAQLAKRAVDPPPEVEPAWQVLVRLGHRLGVKLDYARYEDVRAELVKSGGALAPSGEARA